jgi:hypothetical protein
LADLQVFLVEHSPADRDSVPWEMFEIDPRRQPVMMRCRRRLLLLFVAEKTAGATVDRIPQQAYYRQLLTPAATATADAASERRGVLGWVKRLLPEWLKAILRPWLGRDPQRKPWGATRRGSLR